VGFQDDARVVLGGAVVCDRVGLYEVFVHVPALAPFADVVRVLANRPVSCVALNQNACHV